MNDADAAAGGLDKAERGIEPDSRLLVVDPRTGIEVLGVVETSVGDGVRIKPIGAGYAPGAFTVDPESVIEVVGKPYEEPDDHETRKRKEWDITCMCLLGALENLDETTVDMISSSISTGHL